MKIDCREVQQSDEGWTEPDVQKVEAAISTSLELFRPEFEWSSRSTTTTSPSSRRRDRISPAYKQDVTFKVP